MEICNSAMPVRLITGFSCVKKSAEVFASYGKSCLIVTSGTAAARSGALGDVTETLDSAGIGYRVFSGISQNPMVSSVIAAGKAAREAGAEFLVGIGGGSALDATKAAALCAANPEFDANALYHRAIPSPALPVLLVGTTAGTGSEVTGVSVLTNDATGCKKSISGADCYAAVSFLDAKYTVSAPYAVTVTTALDAFAHAVEGWFSPKCTALPEQYARFALPALYRALENLCATGEVTDAPGREALYLGSVFAGLELNLCGAAFPHTVGYLLTENCGIPHGRACTAFLPVLAEKAQGVCPERLDALCRVLGAELSSVLSVVERLTAVGSLGYNRQCALEWCSRFDETVKNFRNTPGGFTGEEALDALMRLA